MTDDDIIRMTIEASAIGSSDELSGDGIKRFAGLVATFVAAAEQMRCIKIIHGQCGSDNVAQRTVDAIRSQS